MVTCTVTFKLTHTEPGMDTIKAAEFKAKCLALMDEVARTGRPVLITNNGKPVAELRQHRPAPRKSGGVWKDRVVVTGDILSPADVQWDARSK